MQSSSESSDLTDNRQPYDYGTRYPSDAWKWIRLEAIYLACVLLIFTVLVVLMAAPAISGVSNAYFRLMVSILGAPNTSGFILVLIAKFGVIGGTLFDIKWLIHSAAKGSWNQDRVLWRLFTPLTSGTTSAFFALIVLSEIISFFDATSFQSVELAGAFGMLAGYFADGVIGVLTNVAGALFGTVRNRTNEMK